MSKVKLFSIIALCALASTLLPYAASARVQVYENFESGWEGVPWPSGSTGYSNNVTNVTGWVVNMVRIYSNDLDTSNCGEMNAGPSTINAWIQSPLLSNGVGSVIYSARMSGLGVSYTSAIAVEVQYQGETNWLAKATNAIPQPNTYLSFTNFLNSYSNQTVRLRKLIGGSATANFRVLCDNIFISFPAATITNINVTLSPTPPTEYNAMSVTADVAVVGFPDSIAATNFWRSWPATNWTTIPMSTNQLNIFNTITNIPGLPVGSTIDYFVQTTHSYTQKLFFTTTSVFNVSIRPRSNFTNMLITTTPATPMQLGSSYQWQGIANVTNNNPTFKFQGTASGTDTLWGELAQSVSNLPLYGTAETNGNNITLFTTNSGYYVFKFNETNLSFDVRACTYENFASWTNSAYQTAGTYTNNEGWILSGGSISNDPARSRLAILNGTQGSTTNFIQSQQLTNGIGEISFWYRNGATNGNPTTSLSIHVAPSSNSTSWTPVASITNISSASYIFASFPVSDLNNQFIRILNHAAGTNSRVWLDDIAIAAPGPGVQAANLTHSPVNPTMLDPVTISIELIPRNGADLTNVLAWYRNSTNLSFESTPMVLSNGLYIATVPPTAGTVQYAVQYYFTGYQAISPVFFPASGTNSPMSYSATNIISDARSQIFDTSWTGLPWGTYLNNQTNTAGWVVNMVRIYSNDLDTSYCGEMNAGSSTTNAWIQSPLLSNGVGSVIYSARMSGSGASYTSAIAVEVQYQGETNWLAKATNAIPQPNTYLSFTNFLNSYSNQKVRLRKLIGGSATANFRVLCDNIFITYPPAAVSISNVTPNPGYPQAGQSAHISSDILSANPLFPAFNITPRLWYTYNGSTTSIPMTRVTGNTYTSIYPISLTNATRDKQVLYWVKCDFAGYYGIPFDNRSPTYSVTNSFVVRAFSSAYQDVGISVNGSNTTGRLITNGLWQAIFTTLPTNSLSFAIQGTGYSAGTGYSTNMTIWGNTNDWQTSLPLADIATTGQTNFDISGSFSGQYVMRFDETTGQYVINKCVWQDFDNWVGSGGLYKKEVNNNAPLLQNNFDNWTTNLTQIRRESFSDSDWTALSTYTNIGVGGNVGYAIFNSRIASGAVQTTNLATKGLSFVSQSSRGPTGLGAPYDVALKGIGTISFTYRANAAVSNVVGVYSYDQDWDSLANYLNDYFWTPLGSSFTASNTTAITKTVILNTNTTVDIIFAHLFGQASNTVFFDDFSVGEWYADAQTNLSWRTSEGWIEPRAGSSVSNNCLRFDFSRADNGTEQYIMTPLLSNGINAVSFSYCSPSTNPFSFAIESQTQYETTWSNMVSVTISNFNGASSNYASYSFTAGTAATNTYLRILHTTNASGVLLLDDIKIGGAAVGDVWEINNASIDDTDHPIPPQPLGARQFYSGACYLNSNRTANLASGTAMPYTNVWPYIVSPILTQGIGEISFWYRNWTTSGAITPARMIIQTSSSDLTYTNDSYWTTVDILDGIVNTNDYRYYQYVVNDINSRYVRVYNDDQYTSKVGRVCIDDFLVATPIATSLSISNMTLTPPIPLYSDTVNISAEIFQLFLAPSNITLTAYYATATNYAALASASPHAISMSCIASNPATLGQWYKFKTTSPIPTNATDTFVKYYVQASYSGYQASSTSPKTFTTFENFPTWYAPMEQVYDTNQAFYVVYSCAPGAVWINEITPVDGDGLNTYYFTNQYIELCGPNGADIHNWTIEIVDQDEVPVELYTVTNNPSLHPPQAYGYGFWLLGVTNVPGIDQVLTTDAPDPSWLESVVVIGPRKMPIAGGIKLRRSWGPVEYAIFYNTDPSMVPSGYTAIGFHPDTSLSGGLGLTGSGSNYTAFSWAELASATAGSINSGQIFLGETPPVVYIYSVRVNTNVWLECTRTTNWHTLPWYTTNLLSSNSWSVIPLFTRTSSGTNDMLYFSRSTNSTTYFYKVVATNSPW